MIEANSILERVLNEDRCWRLARGVFVGRDGNGGGGGGDRRARCASLLEKEPNSLGRNQGRYKGVGLSTVYRCCKEDSTREQPGSVADNHGWDSFGRKWVRTRLDEVKFAAKTRILRCPAHRQSQTLHNHRYDSKDCRACTD